MYNNYENITPTSQQTPHYTDLTHQPGTVGIINTKNGPMLYPLKDQYVGRSLAKFREFSGVEFQILNLLLPKDGVMIEVGSNIGALSVPLVRVGNRRVLGVEPQSFLFELLKANVGMNGVEGRMQVVWAGCGEEYGELDIPVFNYEADQNWGGVGLDFPDIEKVTKYTIPILPLDYLAQKYPENIDLVKIDVEGQELKVLKGATNVLTVHTPMVWIEADRADNNPAVLEFLEGYGYEVYWFATPFAPMGDKEFDGVWNFNWLAIHPDQKDRFNMQATRVTLENCKNITQVHPISLSLKGES